MEELARTKSCYTRTQQQRWVEDICAAHVFFSDAVDRLVDYCILDGE
jgi:hypothetical protein